MRHGHKLSHKAVEAATKPGLYGDGHGLYLQVSAFGTKAWVFRFMRGGVARKMGMGALHTVSLAEARKRAAALRLAVLDGIDPIAEKAAKRDAVKVERAKAITFAECARQYIASNEAGWKNKTHRDQWFGTFNETRRGSKIFPAATAAINDLPVDQIDVGLILKIIEPLWTKTPESASRIRGPIEAVLDWAKVRNYRSGENPARWRGHLENVLPRRSKIQAVKRHPALPYPELPAFISELRAKGGLAASALELTILTAARTGETINARWSEIDLKAGLWVIPASRMKGGREHRVPLCGRVLAILEALPREGEFVFPGAKPGAPMSNRPMRELLNRMRDDGTTVHGFRSTFRDWAAERTATPNHVIEMALAHAIGNAVEASYRRGDLLDQRRRLMADWASFCESVPVVDGANVLPLRGAS